jgi:hypothetical protein
LYTTIGFLDLLSYGFYLYCLSMLLYFVESHRIAGGKIAWLLSRSDFKQVLLNKGSFIGYGRFIYELPMMSLLCILCFVVGYYLFNSNELEKIFEFFVNWDKYPSTE